MGFKYVKPKSYCPLVNVQDYEEDHNNLYYFLDSLKVTSHCMESTLSLHGYH